MSDRVRKTAGLLLISAAVLLTALGLSPVRRPFEERIIGRGDNEIWLTEIPHLSQADPVNIGDIESLTSLPGIGESTAEMILSERDKKGSFQYPEDLISVRGIGSAKLQAILPYLNMDTDEREN